MQTDHLYEVSFPAAHKIQDTDMVRLYHEQRFDELDAVIVCKDAMGTVTATFGDSDWNCLPFSRKKQKIISHSLILYRHPRYNKS
tara:strand:- start:7 stop:261 length:255 start_codon:yes stop_codon:yes gene_type:complete